MYLSFSLHNNDARAAGPKSTNFPNAFPHAQGVF